MKTSTPSAPPGSRPIDQRARRGQPSPRMSPRPSRRHSRPVRTTPSLSPVLLIGDSINRRLHGRVTNSLDGKAVCYKNPRQRCVLVERLEKHGQLAGARVLPPVRAGIPRVDRRIEAHPRRSGRGRAQLQGAGLGTRRLHLFQGMLDSRSPSMAASYEKNLTCLINDIPKGSSSPEPSRRRQRP